MDVVTQNHDLVDWIPLATTRWLDEAFPNLETFRIYGSLRHFPVVAKDRHDACTRVYLLPSIFKRTIFCTDDLIPWSFGNIVVDCLSNDLGCEVRTSCDLHLKGFQDRAPGVTSTSTASKEELDAS